MAAGPYSGDYASGPNACLSSTLLRGFSGTGHSDGNKPFPNPSIHDHEASEWVCENYGQCGHRADMPS